MCDEQFISYNLIILFQVSETKGAIAFATGKFRTPTSLAFTYCLCVAVKRQVSVCCVYLRSDNQTFSRSQVVEYS